jgi:uncharacterized protein (DUF433 family)
MTGHLVERHLTSTWTCQRSAHTFLQGEITSLTLQVMCNALASAETPRPLSSLAAVPPPPYLHAMNQLERITIDPAVRFGKPCVRGTRLTVGDVLGYLAGGMTEAEVLADFPQLTHEDILACLAFAAERERRLLSIPAA